MPSQKASRYRNRGLARDAIAIVRALPFDETALHRVARPPREYVLTLRRMRGVDDEGQGFGASRG
jgi:hypothetical protein